MTEDKVKTVVRLGVKELEKRLGVDRSTIFRRYKAGTFPAPHYITDQRRWLLSEIEEWEANQIARHAAERRGTRNLLNARTPQPVLAKVSP